MSSRDEKLAVAKLADSDDANQRDENPEKDHRCFICPPNRIRRPGGWYHGLAAVRTAACFSANPFVTLGARTSIYFPLFAPCVGCQSNHTQGDHPYPQGPGNKTPISAYLGSDAAGLTKSTSPKAAGGGGPFPGGYILAMVTDAGSSTGTVNVMTRPSGALTVRWSVLGALGGLAALEFFAIATAPQINSPSHSGVVRIITDMANAPL